MLRYLRIICVAVPVAFMLQSLAAAQDFSVTSAGSSDYRINNQLDPVLELVRGRTYTFSVNATGHPFYIKTAPGAGTADVYSTGVTNNGVTSGTLTFAVPLSAPNTLFYQCSIHDAMGAEIHILNPPAVPALGPAGALLLATLLLVVPMVPRRRRRTA